ncbi:MAG: chaperonin GroEL [Clostridiales bacterium]|jgi:hypothetical protein|nr:chaperonin GroEL [Clostridiales bacterium]
MSYVAPAVRANFESLTIDLKNTILERDVVINTIQDLVNTLEQILAEEKAKNPYLH